MFGPLELMQQFYFYGWWVPNQWYGQCADTVRRGRSRKLHWLVINGKAQQKVPWKKVNRKRYKDEGQSYGILAHTVSSFSLCVSLFLLSLYAIVKDMTSETKRPFCLSHKDQRGFCIFLECHRQTAFVFHFRYDHFLFIRI